MIERGNNVAGDKSLPFRDLEGRLVGGLGNNIDVVQVTVAGFDRSHTEFGWMVVE